MRIMESNADKLIDLKRLLDQGLISQKEFEDLKKEILINHNSNNDD